MFHTFHDQKWVPIHPASRDTKQSAPAHRRHHHHQATWARASPLHRRLKEKKMWGLQFGDGSKPWYLVNPKIAGKWMFIPLKMVSIGIDPYPYIHLVHWNCTSKAVWKSILAFQMCPGTGLGSQEAEPHLTTQRGGGNRQTAHVQGNIWRQHEETMDFTSQVRGVDGCVNDMSVIASLSNPSRMGDIENCSL